MRHANVSLLVLQTQSGRSMWFSWLSLSHVQICVSSLIYITTCIYISLVSVWLSSKEVCCNSFILLNAGTSSL
jgi:hypothetical protein